MANSIIGLKMLPDQNAELVRRLSLRYLRAAEPHNKWAKIAKKCIQYIEGDHWTPEQRQIMAGLKRSALTINRIAPLWRLIQGYHTSNRMDTSFMPTSDAQSREDIGELLSNVFKSEANRTDLKWLDSEMFADGTACGRGWQDIRLCFEENDFGSFKVKTDDPFNILIDPDCNTYDINESAGYVQETVWTDIDHIAANYGSEAAEACLNLTSSGYSSQLLSYLGAEETSPERYFGGYMDDKAMNSWNDIYHQDFVDHQAKRIRLIDSQYKIMSISHCFIDLETGDKQVIPDDWLKPENHHKIQKSLDYAEMIGNPLKVAKRPVHRIRWTTTCADVILHDDWSPYNRYTKVGYFPYFRRGKTRGMVEDLIDPQDEINKKRSVIADILNRNANSGWIYEENTLDPEQEQNLKQYGSSPGVHVKWKRAGKNSESPKRIEPGGYPQGLDRLEEKASIDLNDISGINESALGQMDRVQSGRAIEARQRQAVLAIQMYSDNFSRTKKLQGNNALELFQKHYTEQRIFRVIGEDSKMAVHTINQRQQTGDSSVQRLNDITVGKYSVHVDEVPISATFKQGQFEETMMIIEKLGPVGMLLAQTGPELIIDQTSLPNKQQWKEKLMQAAQQAQAQADAEAMAAGGAAGAPPMPAPAGDPMMAATTPEMVAS